MEKILEAPMREFKANGMKQIIIKPWFRPDYLQIIKGGVWKIF